MAYLTQEQLDQICDDCDGSGYKYVVDEEKERYNNLIGKHVMVPPVKSVRCDVCNGIGIKPKQ